MDALFGHSGFVGSTLARQHRFDARYRSTDIGESAGRAFDLVVWAAAPAQKWLANRDPEADARSIDAIIGHLQRIRARQFVLVSTVDVYSRPDAVTESSPVDLDGLHAYGRNRRRLEVAVEERFASRLVVRLPGLVGPGLRKNAVFDLHHGNNVHAIDSRGVFQFYPMVNLWSDLQAAMRAGLALLHLTAEPLAIADVAREGFGRELRQELDGPPARYDLRSEHAALFGGRGPYQYSRRESLLAIRAYAQSEPKRA